MKRIVHWILAAGLIALAVWSWGFFFPSPQKVIQARLLQLARLASFSSKDGNFKLLANTERISFLMAQNVHVVFNMTGGRSQTFDNREELLQAFLAARPAVKDIQAQFTDITIRLAPDKQSATALLTADAKIGGEPDRVVEELKFAFKKTNDDWLITAIETVKPLR
jgi:hypothetical protein